ncbi:MAG: HDIG domain-containing protein [Spirochaetales bacterium]|nr:HDIG domain-containing protein [Spirochaetales bacterium]
MPTREEAFTLLKKYNESDNLITHGLTVEAVMRYGAEKRGEDVEKWGIVGLLHDIDYEKYPEQHCIKAREIMSEEGWPEEYIHAVCSHGWGICSDVEPVHIMEKYLFACDELTGLINATCLMRPNKSVLDLTVKSVKKKWKSKGFAAGVDRNLVLKGAGMLGLEIEDLMQECIDGMKVAAESIGLKGEL